MTVNLSLLSAIVAATASAAGFMYVTPGTEIDELASEGLIEVNPTVNDNAGNVGARSTEKAVTYLNTPAASGQNGAPTNNPTVPVTSSAETKQTFERVRIAMPADKPRAAGAVSKEEKYPFSTLLPYSQADGMDAIFIAPTAKVPDPAKSLVSAVSAANRKYAKIVGQKTNKKGKIVQVYEKRREFRVFPSEDANKPGAFIGRVDDGSKENLA